MYVKPFYKCSFLVSLNCSLKVLTQWSSILLLITSATDMPAAHMSIYN